MNNDIKAFLRHLIVTVNFAFAHCCGNCNFLVAVIATGMTLNFVFTTFAPTGCVPFTLRQTTSTINKVVEHNDVVNC